ncbi:Glutamate--cysteine ligase [Babesia sp. Xinjiang]|uniref:Glutamate--cysteine ligase n=1 Tax=Babesia sp. Xinjiang TaxID=462227 RepID=UPI000A258687|nr:Glutamate--cysteine ligase [Babesia sp. Xinjiang]ORM40516.1 Glutamate--cysteine ligase [Babesia sp. Xinjiang]
MGFLTIGTPLSFKDTAKRAERIRLLGTLELLQSYLRNHGRKDEVRRFGHECEYMLIQLNPITREAKLMPCAPQLLKRIPDSPEPDSRGYKFMPEFGAFMIEGIPREPWRLDEDYVLDLSKWFADARRHICAVLESMGMQNVYPFTLTSFPLLGVPNTVCEYPMDPSVNRPVMLSEFCSDVLVNPHPRFTTLARNIRTRRGKKVHITSPPFIQSESNVSQNDDPCSSPATVAPIPETDAYDTSSDTVTSDREGYSSEKDENAGHGPSNSHINGSYDYTKEAKDTLSNLFLKPDAGPNVALDEEIDAAVMSNDVRNIIKNIQPSLKPRDPIYMDAMVFGMGMCCLQTTFSCVDEYEARYLYDQLAVLSPLFLALTASTAAFIGTMSSHTTRWRVLSQSVDDRRDEELELVPFSRFSTVTLYISKEPYLLENYKRLNDVAVPSRPDVYKACLDAGIDRVMARHFAYIMARDPLVAFHEDLDAVDTHNTDSHFEAFQSTNWNTVRFKPPPLQAGGSYPIPWRVEFRCCEAQLRDRESACIVAVIALTVRVLLKERWNLYMPMSLVHQNMDASDAQDAIKDHKFYFVDNVANGSEHIGQFTMQEIFFSHDSLGLFNRCARHVEEDFKSGAISKESYDIHMENLQMVKDRICGSRATNSQEIRDYILNHRDFAGNGKVTQQIVFDMLTTLAQSI